jgi:MSHA biogenesis protein MshL
MKFAFNQKLMAKSFGLVVSLGLTACSTIYPPRDTSTQDTINAQLKQAAAPREKVAPLPEAVSSSLLPPIKGTVPKASKKQLEQRFDLVVTDAPINQVLMGIVQDTRYSIMVKPKNAIPGAPVSTVVAAAAAPPLTDRVTVNLKNVTMFEALDSIREVYGYDYTLDGNRIYVQQPELQTRLYQINYIIGQRRGVSDIQVIGGASIGSSSSGSTSSTTGGSTGSYSSVQATGLSTNAKSDVWGEVEDVLRTTLGCQIAGKLAEPTNTNTNTTATTTANAAGRADVTFKGEIPSGERKRGVDGCTDGRAMSISQMSGTILVRGMPNEDLVSD